MKPAEAVGRRAEVRLVARRGVQPDHAAVRALERPVVSSLSTSRASRGHGRRAMRSTSRHASVISPIRAGAHARAYASRESCPHDGATRPRATCPLPRHRRGRLRGATRTVPVVGTAARTFALPARSRGPRRGTGKRASAAASAQLSPTPTSTASAGSRSYAPHISARTSSRTFDTSGSGTSSSSSSCTWRTRRAPRPFLAAAAARCGSSPP